MNKMANGIMTLIGTAAFIVGILLMTLGWIEQLLILFIPGVLFNFFAGIWLGVNGTMQYLEEQREKRNEGQ